MVSAKACGEANFRPTSRTALVASNRERNRARWRCVKMVIRIAKLEAALRVNAALLVHAQRLIAAFMAPESDKAAIISELIRLLDGPAQREAKRLADVALGEAGGVEEDRPALTHQIRGLPLRFWAQVVGGGTTGVLFVVTPFWPNWIEAVFRGFNPDQHSGLIEWIIRYSPACRHAGDAKWDSVD